MLPQRSRDEISWATLLAPYSQGAPLLDDFRIDDIRRGEQQEVVISVRRPDDPSGVEVHVVPRGLWTGVHESRSFGIGYELPRSPAAQRDAITAVIARTLEARDHGLPPPAAIPLGTDFNAGSGWPAMLRGWRGALLAASGLLFVGLFVWRAPALAFAALALGGVDLLTRLVATFSGGADLAAADNIATGLDPAVRLIQLAWVVLIVASPVLCWRTGRALGIAGARLLAVVALCALVGLGATWRRDDAPLHANGHAWREAREVLLPWGMRSNGAAPFMHGRAGIALQWLLASAERTLRGAADPFDISRAGFAAAAGATAFLAAVLVRSTAAGLAAGVVLALTPLAQSLALSGSVLAIAAWILPWSLGLLIAAGSSGDRVLLAGAILAAALGTLSHTAMLAWAPTLCVVWVVAARRPFRLRAFALGGLAVLALAWGAEAVNTAAMVSGRNGGAGVGLLEAARRGFLHRNLLFDAGWVSPLLLPLIGVWAIAAALRREQRAAAAGSILAVTLAALPFFAVTACSSDAIRYQAPLLGLTTSLAVAGLWSIPVAWLGWIGAGLLRVAVLSVLVALPWTAVPMPLDPVAVEHRLVAEAAPRIAPRTLVVLPPERFGNGMVIADFPDFLLPENAYVVFAGDPAIDAYAGPKLFYLGLACISYGRDDDLSANPDLRPECLALRANTHPWLVRSLRPEDLPRDASGAAWTFHQLATDVPFGFFAPN
ncbi:MAG: hypothetical protein ABI629_10960 [bacterium]